MSRKAHSTVLLGCILMFFGLPTGGNAEVVAAVPPASNVVRLSEPIASDAHSETFGALWDGEREVVSLKRALEQIDQYVEQPLVVQASVARVCQKKGCFFIAQDGGHAVRVSFRDYGFFIPTDAAGKSVVLAGELVRTQVSQEDTDHYAQDLRLADGETASTLRAGEVVELVADGIRIPL